MVVLQGNSSPPFNDEFLSPPGLLSPSSFGERNSKVSGYPRTEIWASVGGFVSSIVGFHFLFGNIELICGDGAFPALIEI
jgi:hypothetical protein